MSTYREQLTAIFEEHAPKHLGDIDKLLDQWGGREEQLIASLNKKYTERKQQNGGTGATGGGGKYRQQLKDFYAARGIVKDDQAIDTALETWKDDEESMFKALKQKYPLPEEAKAMDEERAQYKEKLRAFYTSRRAKVDEKALDSALETWKGKEEMMFAALEKKYPPVSADSTKPSSPTKKDAAAIGQCKQRLKDFYAARGIPKDEKALDTALETWEGREEEMFLALKQKYPLPSGGEQEPAAAAAPASSGAAANGTGDTRTKYKERLRAFYAARGTSKDEKSIDTALDTWKGQEEEMFEALEKKYPLPGGGGGSPSSPAPAAPQAQGPQSTDYKQRLKDFYTARGATKSEKSMNTALEQWKGKEEQMLAALEKKYPLEKHGRPAGGSGGGSGDPGGSPVASPLGSPQIVKPSSPPASPKTQPQDHRARLVAFFQKYDPAKFNQVDRLLEGWKGREEEMFTTLAKRYEGKTPKSGGYVGSNPRERLLSFYTRRDLPRDEAEIEAALESWKGRENEMFAMLDRKYATLYKPRLIEFYEMRGIPKGEKELDMSLDTWKGKEEEMFEVLEQKYPLGGVYGAQNYKQRLKDFYAAHGMEKTDADISNALETWKGDEENMFAALEGKYGKAPSPYKKRLREFYAQRGITREEKDLDAALDSFAGKEDQMFAALEAKYPLVTQDSTTFHEKGAAAPSTVPDSRTRLVDFYTKYAPDCLPDVDKTLESWKGREEEMFKHLKQKHCEPQSPPASPPVITQEQEQAPKGDEDPNRAKLRAFYAKYVPGKSESDITNALSTWKGREDEMFVVLRRKYGLPADAPVDESSSRQQQEQHRIRLKRFYEQHAPEKTDADVETALETWAGREPEMFQKLEETYQLPPGASAPRYEAPEVAPKGAPKEVPAAAEPSSPTRVPRLRDGRTFRDRLAAFCAHRCPEKLEDLDEILTSWKGQEEELMASMVSKYGPEPPLGTEAPSVSSKPKARRTLRDRLEAFYHDRGIEMDIDLDKAVQIWEGREEELMKYLENKYGVATAPLPTPSYLSRAEARAELIELYRECCPDKVPTADRTLDLWVGRETEMLRVLTRKYRAANVESGRDDIATQVELLSKRITAMYCRYLPGRLAELPSVLEAHEGNEAELLETLVVRFGPEPDPYDFQTRLERIYAYYDPEKILDVKSLAAQASGREEFVLRTMTKRYGPEPGAKYVVPPSNVSASNPKNDRHRIRITRWFMLKCPKRAPQVDYYLVRFAGREGMLFRILSETMGPEPRDEPMQETIRSRYLTTPALHAYFAKRQSPPFLNWLWNGTLEGELNPASKPSPYSTVSTLTRDRLIRFYNHYHPIKISEVDETLARWRGREELLFEALVHKYGAEPPAEVPSRTEPSAVRHQSALSPPSVQTHQQTTPRAVLQSYYAVKNPGKLKDIESTLERFQGREEVMYHMLNTKYGENPLMVPGGDGREQTLQQQLSVSSSDLGMGGGGSVDPSSPTSGSLPNIPTMARRPPSLM